MTCHDVTMITCGDQVAVWGLLAPGPAPVSRLRSAHPGPAGHGPGLRLSRRLLHLRPVLGPPGHRGRAVHAGRGRGGHLQAVLRQVSPLCRIRHTNSLRMFLHSRRIKILFLPQTFMVIFFSLKAPWCARCEKVIISEPGMKNILFNV